MVPGRSLRERGKVTSPARDIEFSVRRPAAPGGGGSRNGAFASFAVLIDAVTDELRRRFGRAPLADLAAAYEGAEEWVRESSLRSARPKFRAGVRDAALVQDAAFAALRAGRERLRPLSGGARATETRGPRAPALAGGERRRRALVWVGRVLVLGAVFFLGLAVGRAVEQGPEPADDSGQTLSSDPKVPTPSPRRRRSPLRFQTREIRKNRSTFVSFFPCGRREYPHP